MGEKIVIYGGSLHPTCTHHRLIVERLRDRFGSVVVYPCWKRPDKASVNGLDPMHRLNMAKIAFANADNVSIDTYDFDSQNYTPTYLIDERYKRMYPDHDIVHVVGTDILMVNEDGIAELDTWDRGTDLRNNLNFIVLGRPGYEVEDIHLPNNSIYIELVGLKGSGTLVRDMLRSNQNMDDYLDPEVLAYCKKHNLYLS